MMPRAYRCSALRLRFLSSSPVQSTVVPRAENGRPPCRVRSSSVQSTVVPRAGDDFLKRKKLFENVNA